MNPAESAQDFRSYPVVEYDGTNHEAACKALGLEA